MAVWKKKLKTWTEMTLGNEDLLERKSVWFFIAQSFHWSEAGRQGVHVLTRIARRGMITKGMQADSACAHRRTSTREEKYSSPIFSANWIWKKLKILAKVESKD